jgi:hypothetical protein
MYEKNDPRAVMAASQTKAPAPISSELPDPEYGLYYQEAPADDDANGKTWYTRGRNFLVAYTEAKPGAVFSRKGQVDEYMVLVPYVDTPVDASSGAQTEHTDGRAVIIMPPGDSSLTLEKGGIITRIFTVRSEDLVAKCSNPDLAPYDAVPPLENWPAPPAGYKVRLYSLDVPPQPGRLGRIWRCTTMMVNYPEGRPGARDLTKVSPHSHDDFEQCSLILAGRYKHHMRWPWSINAYTWKEDAHAEVLSPSVTFIPAQVIHTSTSHDEGLNQLIDLFSPPRKDFSKQPGWVLNADEYPMPAEGNA